MSKGNLREQMPVVAAFIDDMRKTFGEAYINNIIRQGINGQPVFYACENGHAIGTPPRPAQVIEERPLSRRERALDRQYAACREYLNTPPPGVDNNNVTKGQAK